MDLRGNPSILIDNCKIKVENNDEHINSYATSTMNEILGWYGYENKPRNKSKMLSCCDNNGNISSGPDSPKYSGLCDWCAHNIDENKSISSAGGTFCSELCFSQSRRANFKKNKTCDWCKHIRPSVSYVDFQDGASQLQFCSDKCLNQYKMHIFCRETRAHLKMHPHYVCEGKSSGILITPDLWMKNNKGNDFPDRFSPPLLPPSKEDDHQPSTLPVISLVHPLKLMNQDKQEFANVASKRTKRKRNNRISQDFSSCNAYPEKTLWNDSPQDLTVKSTSTFGQGLNSTDKNVTKDKCETNYSSKYAKQDPLCSNLFGKNLPPVTVLVPYPIFVPVPLPIPIPFDSNLLGKSNGTSEKKSPQEINDSKNILELNCDRILDAKKLLDLNKQQKILRNNSQQENSALWEKEIDTGKEKELHNLQGVSKMQNSRLRSLRKRKRMVDVKKKRLLNKKRIVLS